MYRSRKVVCAGILETELCEEAVLHRKGENQMSKLRSERRVRKRRPPRFFGFPSKAGETIYGAFDLC